MTENLITIHSKKPYAIGVKDADTNQLVTTQNDTEILVFSSIAWVGNGFNFFPISKAVSAGDNMYSGMDSDSVHTYQTLGDALKVCQAKETLDALNHKLPESNHDLVVLKLASGVQEIFNADIETIAEFNVSQMVKLISSELSPEEIALVVERLSDDLSESIGGEE